MKKILLLGLVALTAVTTTSSLVNAQTITFECIGGSLCFLLPNVAIECDVAVLSGSGEFEPAPPIPLTGPMNSTAFPVKFTVSANAPSLSLEGIKIMLDDSRAPTNSLIQSRNEMCPNFRFPISVNLRFYARATVESMPGVEMISLREMQLCADNANSIAPFQTEKFDLCGNEVEFIRVDTGAPVFTLMPESYIYLGPTPEGR